MRFRCVMAGLLLAVSAGACSLGSSADAGTINLYLELDKASVGFGDSVRITVTARNVGYETLTLTGPSDCLMYVEVLNAQGAVVWHSKTFCSGSQVTEEIAIGVDKVQTFYWTGVGLAGARLSGGYYDIRAIALVTGAAYVGPPLSIALE